MCNFCMLSSHPPRHGVDTLQKNILTLEKKERPALEGDTFNSYPNPSSTAAMFFSLYFVLIRFETVTSAEPVLS